MFTNHYPFPSLSCHTFIEDRCVGYSMFLFPTLNLLVPLNFQISSLPFVITFSSISSGLFLILFSSNHVIPFSLRSHRCSHGLSLVLAFIDKTTYLSLVVSSSSVKWSPSSRHYIESFILYKNPAGNFPVSWHLVLRRHLLLLHISFRWLFLTCCKALYRLLNF